MKTTEQMPSIIQAWESGYDELWNWFGPCFRYKTTRAHGKRYVRGLLGRIERKNGRQLAEYLGDSYPCAVQNFLGRAAWDADKVRDAAQLCGKPKYQWRAIFIGRNGVEGIWRRRHQYISKKYHYKTRGCNNLQL